jgi:transposase
VSLSRPSYEELAALVVEQAATIAQLRADVAELRGEVAELKRQLAANSRNSSRPPSSDGLAKPPAPKSLRRPSGRKPGGQDGHKGGHLAQVATPDDLVAHALARCAGCAGDLAEAVVLEPRVRQVFDLPEVALRVTEHVAERRRCACGHESTAVFPDGVSAPAQYGPRVRALGLYLVAYQHLPYARAAELLGDWIGAPVSTGTLAAFIAQGAEDLEGFLEEIQARVIASPVVHFDETGARADGRLRWLFCASTETATFYSLHDKRGHDGLQAAGVLANFTGTAVHDGFQPYRRYTNAQHALCNVHHLRELLAVIEQHPDDPNQSWAPGMDRLLRELHITVNQARLGGQERLDPIVLAGYRAAYEQTIALGHQQNPPITQRTGLRGRIGQTKTRNLLMRLDRDRQDVLRFAHDFSVPFDNNLAERDIRMIKLQQKISGCWRTITGAQQFLALRAYLSTARKNQHPTLDALTALASGTPWHPTT